MALWDPKIGRYVAYRRLHQPQNRTCFRCLPKAASGDVPAPPEKNTTTCAYECPGGKCSGCANTSPFTCATDKDCNGKVHTCKGKATSCVAGVCSSGAGGELCTVSPAASAKYAHCGRGSAAERFVGRCESDDFGVFAGCDEGKPPNETSYTTVFGPDDQARLTLSGLES